MADPFVEDDYDLEYAQKIITMLCGRSGFDGWWGDIDDDTKQEIRCELADIIREAR